MDDIIVKLADEFEIEANKDLFGDFSSHKEAKHLTTLAGRLNYKADKKNC